jgi:hypothetical protein
MALVLETRLAAIHRAVLETACILVTMIGTDSHTVNVPAV